ncbi:MAG TPA: DUF6089 family protein [Fulvivirga sp.]|nr:DUF6089 family protein [Fulvivirga sp.]
MKRILILFIFIAIAGELAAQSFYKYKRGRDVIANLGTGYSTYFGELKDDGDYFDPRPNLNIGLQYFFSPRVGARMEATWFKIGGDDAKTNEGGKFKRNLSFISNNFELNVVGIVQAFPNGVKYYQRSPFNVYGFVGIGFLYFNPKAELNGKKYALQPIQTEGVSYSRFAIVIPYGIGIKYKLNPFFNIGLEGGFRQTFTDYLDDVSSTYVDNSSFSNPIHASLADRSPEIGRSPNEAGTLRGNPSTNDSYFIMNIKLEFYLPPQILSSFKFNKGRKGPMKRKRRR